MRKLVWRKKQVLSRFLWEIRYCALRQQRFASPALSGYMKTVKFNTLGCKVNQYETQEIRERFLGYGFKEIDNGKKADVYVINTCTVTHRADADSLLFIRKAKRENKKAKIIVTGCLT